MRTVMRSCGNTTDDEMSNRKQRESNRANHRKLMATLKTNECMNCHELIAGGHFVPPSFGEEGFFVCTTPEQQAIASVLEEPK